jgi:ParB-like chromosome segregation protein Spo0J
MSHDAEPTPPIRITKDGHIIDGNHRRQAVRKILEDAGLDFTVEVIVLDDIEDRP